MPVVINPFDAGGYTLAEMTQAINILPNIYTRLGEMGLFRFEGVTQRSVIIEQAEGVLNLLPTVPLGGPATVARADIYLHDRQLTFTSRASATLPSTVLQPSDCSRPAIALAGGVRRTCVLRFPDFAVDETSLRAAFSERTRMVLLNTPHNPTGKVFTRAEIEFIAQLAREYDAWVVTDEVYEHLIFDGAEHIPMATLPGMAERTLTISSAGKTFSTTGWKVGWVSGPADAVAAIRAVKQFVTYVGSGPFQPAVATGLGLGDDVYAGLGRTLQAKRDLLVAGLREAGLAVSVPRGTYFVIADAASLGARDALEFCRELPERAGVVGIPVTVFCDDQDAARTLVRFAFCKRDEVLREACRRLGSLAS